MNAFRRFSYEKKIPSKIVQTFQKKNLIEVV